MSNRVPENFTLADLKGRNFATVSEAAAILRIDPKTVRRVTPLAGDGTGADHAAPGGPRSRS
jgi:hypothetical protein